MPHVGDGEIHAYLDGALELFPPAEAERIRDHLRSCPDCGRRVEEEKGLREGAEAILGAAGPEVGEVPPFEEIRARASAAGPAPRARRVPPTLLPWAASIVLAVAVGWGTRGALLDRTVGAPDVAAREATEGPAGRLADAHPEATEVLDAIVAGDVDPVAARTAEVTPAAGAVTVDVDQVPGDAFRTADARSGRGAAQARNAPAPEPPSPRDAAVGDMSKAVAEAAAEDPAAEEEAAPPARAESEVAAFADRGELDRESGEPADLQARRGLGESSSSLAQGQERLDEVDARVARQAGEGGEPRARAGALESSAVSPAGLMIPGLPVESIDVDPAMGAAGGVRIVQRLPGGERLELLFMSGGVAARSRDEVATAGVAGDDRVTAPEGPEEWSRIEVPRSGGLLIARSPVPMDSLSALVAHLR